MLPEHPAVGRGDTDGASSAREHDLQNTVDGGRVGRAVTVAARRAHPASFARCERIGCELAASRDDNEVVDHEWRGCEAPHWRRRIEVGHRVSRPQEPAVSGVECVEEARGAERKDTICGNRRCRTRSGAAHSLLEPHGIGVTPHRPARRNTVGADDFVAATLLLCIENIAVDRERRPAGTDVSAPQLGRRSRRPIGVNPTHRG